MSEIEETKDEVIEEAEVTDKPKSRSVSYSQYSMWANCPQQWKLAYVDGFKDARGIELSFGKAIHETVQHWLTLMYGDSPLKARTFDMNQMFKEQLMNYAKSDLLADGRQLTTKEELMEYYVDGCKILEHFRQHSKEWFQKSFELKGVEVPLNIELGRNIRFKGFIDIVLWHKSAKMLYIYDFKTSRWGWTHQKKDTKKTDQLLLYKKFYSQKYGIPESNIKVEFIILKRKINENSEFKVKHIVGFEPANGTPSLNKAMDRFENFLSTAFNDDGTPRLETVKATPSESACKYCPFKNDETKCTASFYLPNNKRNIKKFFGEK